MRFIYDLRDWLWRFLPSFLAWAGLLIGFLGNYAAGSFLLLASLYIALSDFGFLDLHLTDVEDDDKEGK